MAVAAVKACVICHRLTCRDYRTCRGELARLCASFPDRGEREPIPPNSADLVLTVDEWRTKYGRTRA